MLEILHPVTTSVYNLAVLNDSAHASRRVGLIPASEDGINFFGCRINSSTGTRFRLAIQGGHCPTSPLVTHIDSLVEAVGNPEAITNEAKAPSCDGGGVQAVIGLPPTEPSPLILSN